MSMNAVPQEHRKRLLRRRSSVEPVSLATLEEQASVSAQKNLAVLQVVEEVPELSALEEPYRIAIQEYIDRKEQEMLSLKESHELELELLLRKYAEDEEEWSQSLADREAAIREASAELQRLREAAKRPLLSKKQGKI